jgi:hypothetical protein
LRAAEEHRHDREDDQQVWSDDLSKYDVHRGSPFLSTPSGDQLVS